MNLHVAEFGFDNTFARDMEGFYVPWQDRCLRDGHSPVERRIEMKRVNPIYIPRNHNVEAALSAENEGNLAPFTRLLDVLSAP